MHLKWSYSPEKPNLAQNRRFFESCDLEIWRMTLLNNRAPLLGNTKPCASFHHRMWIQTGVMLRKRLNGFFTSVTLAFDLWPWPLAWTSRRSLVIISKNLMMIRWWEHSEKDVKDGQADGRTEPFIELLGRSSKTVYCGCLALFLKQAPHINWKLMRQLMQFILKLCVWLYIPVIYIYI